MKMAKELESRQGQSASTGASIALIYVGLGDHDRARNWLDKAYEVRSNPSILMRPESDSIRSPPPFSRSVAKDRPSWPRWPTRRCRPLTCFVTRARAAFRAT